jgi:hypothetical protein
VQLDKLRFRVNNAGGGAASTTPRGLASDEAVGITGQVISVDGGYKV